MKSTPLDGCVVGLGREAGIVAAGDDRDAGLERADAAHQPQRRPALERHDREPDDVRLLVAHQPLDGLGDAVLHEDQVGDGDP